MSQKFCNILVTGEISRCFCPRRKGKEPHWTVIFCVCPRNSECFSQDLSYRWEQFFGIHGFRTSWSCLFVKILVTWTEFLEPSSNCDVPLSFAQKKMFIFAVLHLNHMVRYSGRRNSASTDHILLSKAVTFSAAWSASFKRCTCRKLARPKMSQNFWFTLVNMPEIYLKSQTTAQSQYLRECKLGRTPNNLNIPIN